MTPVSGVCVGFASVSDHIDYIPDTAAQAAQELGKYTSTVDNPSFSTTPTTKYVDSTVVQPLLRTLEENGRDRGFGLPSSSFVYFRGLVFLPARR